MEGFWNRNDTLKHEYLYMRALGSKLSICNQSVS